MFVTLLVMGVLMISPSLSNAQAGRTNLQNLQTIEVDDFDQEGAWIVKYSRFRSAVWFPTKTADSGASPAPATSGKAPDLPEFRLEPQKAQYARDSNVSWMRWIGKDPTNASDSIVPEGLVKRKNTDADKCKGADKTERERILGIRAKWDFPGYNWLTLEPSYTRSAGYYHGMAEFAENTPPPAGTPAPPVTSQIIAVSWIRVI